MSRSGEKFVPRSRVGTFRNERKRSTPLDSKIMFWCVLYYLNAFETVWLPYKTQYKTGRSGAKVRAMKSCRNFSQRKDPKHPFGPFPHISVRFVLFGCIWDSLLRYNTKFKTGQTCANVRATKSRWNFSQRRTRSTPLDPKLMFWCVSYYLSAFATISLPTKLRAKHAEVVQKFVP